MPKISLNLMLLLYHALRALSIPEKGIGRPRP